jgi:outer membrane lipopolysaccharide assembly protein LptE/RlpB
MWLQINLKIASAKTILKTIASAVVLSLLLTACGFQLRGYQNQSVFAKPVNIIIQAPTNSEKQIDYQQFNQHLQRNLAAANIEQNTAYINSSTSTSKATLTSQTVAIVKIESLTFSSQGISRDHLGRANEFNLYCRISYSSNLIAGEADAVTEANLQLVTVSANYFYDPERPTAGELQKRRTEKALLKQAAGLFSQTLINQIHQAQIQQIQTGEAHQQPLMPPVKQSIEQP